MKFLCITMPETPVRRAICENHFKEVGMNNVDFITGINAPYMGLATTKPYRVDNADSKETMPQASVGIFLSHYCTWITCSKLADDYFLIMEDDIKWPKDWESRILGALRDAPEDFDMLYVGNCCCDGKPQERIAGDVFVVQWPLCLHAYIVAKKVLPTLLAGQRNCYGPIDVTLAIHTLPYIKAYTVLPRIANQSTKDVPL